MDRLPWDANEELEEVLTSVEGEAVPKKEG